MDRQVYGDFNLTVARHPSETDERMMLRLFAFAVHAEEDLEFGRGISAADEPDLWHRNLTGDIEQWIDLGTPDPSRIRKACGRSREVVIYAYGERATAIWWQKQGEALQRFDNLQVSLIADDIAGQLAAMAAPGMTLQSTLEAGEVWFSDGVHSVLIRPERLKDWNHRP